MKGTRTLALAGTAWLAAAGCINPRTTELPTLRPSRPPAAERRSLERFDPFPDPTLGPETETRPESFQRGREPQRRAQENQHFQGAAPAGPVAPGYSSGAYRDGDVVR